MTQIPRLWRREPASSRAQLGDWEVVFLSKVITGHIARILLICPIWGFSNNLDPSLTVTIIQPI